MVQWCFQDVAMQGSQGVKMLNEMKPSQTPDKYWSENRIIIKSASYLLSSNMVYILSI